MMNLLLSREENIQHVKTHISTLVHDKHGLRKFANEHGSMILDTIFNAITDPNTPVFTDSFFILSNFAWADIIQGRFITPSIELYMSCDDAKMRKEIIYYLINVYYDDDFHDVLMEAGFIKCLPIYIDDWNAHIQNNRGKLTESANNEVNVLYNMLKSYVEYNPDYNVNIETYHALFSICSNLCFNDKTDKYFINLGRKMYFEYEDAPDLHNEILFFFTNVYLDDNSDELIPDFDKYANDFIGRYYTLYDDLVMDILEIYKLTEFNPTVLDVAIKLLRDNLHVKKNHNRITKFLRFMSDNTESAEYICNNPLTKQMIQNSLHTGEYLYTLSYTFACFTGNTHTEIPCQFYYNYFVTRWNENRIYPNYILFSLSNILASPENYSFVDAKCLTSLLTTVLYQYTDDTRLHDDLYHIVKNLYESNHLVECIRNDNFIDAFKFWMNGKTMTFDSYNIIKYVCKTISCHDDLYYLFDTTFGSIVLNIAQHAQHTYILSGIEQYMNCTLQQKCALTLYKKNKIELSELEELGIRLHLLA